MSIRCEQETNVCDEFDNLLGQVNQDPTCFPTFFPAAEVEITIDELREIVDYLESL